MITDFFPLFFCFQPSRPKWSMIKGAVYKDLYTSRNLLYALGQICKFWAMKLVLDWLTRCYSGASEHKWVSSTPFGVPFLVQKHFNIISKKFCCGFYMKKNAAFTLISFTLLKWDDCLSVQLPFELPVQIPVQLLLELEPNWLVQNVIELEFELSRM